MPWKTTNMNELRREFVTKALQRAASFTSLCREFGISRKTGYKWKQRALADGLSGLAEHSRRPRRSPRQLEEAMVCSLIRLKLCHPRWGPKKLCTLFARRHGVAPSISSCQRVLNRAGLVQHKPRRVHRPTERLTTAMVACAPNEVWTVDFKGWWRLGNGQRCEPLTIRDQFSRFVLALRVAPKADTASVRTEFARVFQAYGLPKVIRSDNGSPFASCVAPLGLSRLSAWWVMLGIELDRSRPAHPQDNGAHERLHRDIESELALHVQADSASQQAACELWREEFNWERPHEALKGRCPGDLYQKSKRPYPNEPLRLEYGTGFFPRRVNKIGCVRWDREKIFISTAIAGCDVGLRVATPNQVEIWLNYLLLGNIEPETSTFRGAAWRSAEGARPSP